MSATARSPCRYCWLLSRRKQS